MVLIQFFAFLFLIFTFHTPVLALVPDSPESFLRNKIVKEFAPVWVHHVDYEPRYDAMTSFDFDGNLSGFDNVKNAEKYPLPAHVYGSVIAETKEAYYIFYGVYHVKDYDRKYREFFFPSASHDNDFEGAMVVVSKDTRKILAIETWFHSLFLQCGHSALTNGNQSIDAKIHVEKNTHPIIYVDSKGHGVRCFQKSDEERFSKSQYKIYRLGKVPTADLRKHDGMQVHYTILDMNDFIRYAKGPFNSESMFSESAEYGLGDEPLGMFLSGNFQGNSSWARPKPPWSWTDKFDSMRPGAWFFHPAYVFNKHFGLNISNQYIHHWPLEALYEISPDALNLWAEEERSDSWFAGKPRGYFEKKVRKLKKKLYKIVEYLFFHFG